MANEEKQSLIFNVQLVKIEWNGGANTHRFINKTGFINYSGAYWFAQDDVQGQILNIGSVTEKSGEVSTNDLTLSMTAFLNGQILSGTYADTKVTIYEGYRDVNNGFIYKGESVWRISEYENQGGLSGTVNFVLVLDGVYKIKNKSKPLTYSGESQKILTSTTDTGFRYISAAVVSVGAAGGSQQQIINYNGMNDEY